MLALRTRRRFPQHSQRCPRRAPPAGSRQRLIHLRHRDREADQFAVHLDDDRWRSRSMMRRNDAVVAENFCRHARWSAMVR